jgi:phytanoyl-CoA hydroxylase
MGGWSMDGSEAVRGRGLLDAGEIVGYRRDGYVVVRGLIAPRLVAAALDAISGLASGRIAARSTQIAFEPGVDPAGIAPGAREGFIRKFAGYIEDSDVLRAVAMSRRLHLILDQLLGQGREVLQDMALIKPPRVGGAKPWHQDAAYFRVRDPSLIVGVWIALDPARRANGCMQVIPGSHLGGPAEHVPAEDVNLCEIRPDRVRLADRVHVEMEPGDALIFHPLLHHYTAANDSDLRRRAVQFHFNQTGTVWTDLATHRRLFRDEHGAYAGCTVPHGVLAAGGEIPWPEGRKMPVVPVDDWT